MLEYLIRFSWNIAPEFILVGEYFICLITLSAMTYLFKEAGIITYIALAVIIANIQVLKTVSFSFATYPIALGTIIFSSTFLAVDILTEFYGAYKARKAVWIGFIASLFFTLLMLLTTAIKPSPESADTQGAMESIFMPLPSLFFASLIAYFFAQRMDIIIFQLIKHLTKSKYLWLRTSLALMTSALLDNIIFNYFAFVILAKEAVSFNSLIHTYIIGTCIFRTVIALLQVPVIYIIRKFIN